MDGMAQGGGALRFRHDGGQLRGAGDGARGDNGARDAAGIFFFAIARDGQAEQIELVDQQQYLVQRFSKGRGVEQLRAEGADATFMAVRLPYRVQADEADAQLALDFITPDREITFNIERGVDGVDAEYIEATGDPLLDFTKGNVKARNLGAYTPLRLSDVPELDISFVESTEAPVGLGEPATTVVGPAIGNAIYNAVGARLRHIPITPAAVKAALA